MLKAVLLLLISCALPLFSEVGPNHLEPIPPNRWHPHLTLGVDILIPKSNVVCWMIACPAFGGEYAVSILNTSTNANKPTYEVHYSKAPASFMSPPPPPAPGMRRSKASIHQHDAQLMKYSRKISTRIAELVLAAWSKAIKDTRYANDYSRHIGCDGISYYFNYSDGYFGTTWSPSSPVPATLVDLSNSLIDLVIQNQSDTIGLEQAIESDCASLIAKIETSHAPTRP